MVNKKVGKNGKKQFKVVARVCGDIDVLLGNEVPPAFDCILDPDNDVEAQLLKLREASNLAYTDDTRFKIFNPAVTDKPLDGDAALAF